jgi:hypothetical protein
LGNRSKKDKKDIEDKDRDKDNSKGETIGSKDWSLDKSNDNLQEHQDLEEFIVKDNWGKEESNIDFTESNKEYNSNNSTV